MSIKSSVFIILIFCKLFLNSNKKAQINILSSFVLILLREENFRDI